MQLFWHPIQQMIDGYHCCTYIYDTVSIVQWNQVDVCWTHEVRRLSSASILSINNLNPHFEIIDYKPYKVWQRMDCFNFHKPNDFLFIIRSSFANCQPMSMPHFSELLNTLKKTLQMRLMNSYFSNLSQKCKYIFMLLFLH